MRGQTAQVASEVRIMTRTIVNVVCLIVLLDTIAISQQTTDPASTMTVAATKFLDSLNDEQEAATLFPFHSEDRFDWHAIPRERKGLPLKAMTASQRSAALDLVRVGLSETGFTKAEAIRQLEVVLFALDGLNIRDPDQYFFMVFGEPSVRNSWGWRYEGHHLSQNWTIVNGTAIASSPQFFGTNPAEVREGPRRGMRVLGNEEDQARALLASMNTTQRASAIIGNEAPPDILTSSKREIAMLEDLGVAHHDLNADQRKVLWSIIEEYARAQPDTVANQRLTTILSAGLKNIKFGWMGGAARGEPHYYRIQGPTFLIEYDNTQNDANHAHSVWRDFKGDFGRDLLAGHYQQFSHAPINANN
jgi:hypothetical protein